MRHELPLPLPVLAAEADDMTGPSGDACRAGAAPGGEKKKEKPKGRKAHGVRQPGRPTGPNPTSGERSATRTTHSWPILALPSFLLSRGSVLCHIAVAVAGRPPVGSTRRAPPRLVLPFTCGEGMRQNGACNKCGNRDAGFYLGLGVAFHKTKAAKIFLLTYCALDDVASCKQEKQELSISATTGRGSHLSARGERECIHAMHAWRGRTFM